jgi:hypothetical protein
MGMRHDMPIGTDSAVLLPIRQSMLLKCWLAAAAPKKNTTDRVKMNVTILLLGVFT